MIALAPWAAFIEALLPQKEAAGVELLKSAYALAATPEFLDAENKLEAFIAASGGRVTRDVKSGHIATIEPPAPYVAPAHQSPADFNAHRE